MQCGVWYHYQLLSSQVLLHKKKGENTGVVDINIRLRDTEEGMGGRHPLQGYVVIFKYVPWMDILFMLQTIVVQLVVHDDGVRAPAHDGGNLSRMLIVFGHLPLLSCAHSYCISKQKVEEEVTNMHHQSEEAHSPVEQPHLIPVQKPNHWTRTFQAPYEVLHV